MNVRELRRTDITQQEVSVGRFRKARVESQGAPRPRLILIDIPHRRAQVYAKLERVIAHRLCERVHPLKLLWDLLLGKKVRRTRENVADVGETDLRNSAGNCRIFGNAGDEFVNLVQTEGILFGMGKVAQEAKPKLIDESRSKHVRPPKRERLALEHLPAPRRR